MNRIGLDMILGVKQEKTLTERKLFVRKVFFSLV